MSVPPTVKTLAEVKREAFIAAMTASAGDRRLAAKALGISLKTVYNVFARDPELRRSFPMPPKPPKPTCVECGQIIPPQREQAHSTAATVPA